MITYVKLNNWRSHLESEFIFSNGTNALLGSMGSGKTSVLDAVCFALFGTFPSLQTKKLKLDDIIMKKPDEKNRAEVEVHFSINGKSYVVKRVVEKGKGTSYSEIKEGGKLLEAPNSQRVTEIVEQILKVDYELFSKAIYSEQNALDYFLTIPKGQRMRKIDELLAIDKFEKSRSASVTLMNRIADRKSGIESIIGQINEGELKKNISELESTIARMLSEKEQLKRDYQKVSEERKRIESELKDLQAIKNKLDALKMEQRGIESAINETDNALKSIEKSVIGVSRESVERNLEDLEKEVGRLEENLRQKREFYEKFAANVSQAKSKSNFLKEEKISVLDLSLKEKIEIKKEFDHLLSLVGENIEDQLEKKKKELDNIRSEASETNALIKDIELFIQHLSSAENKCPVCDSVLTSERKNLIIIEKKKQLRNMEEKLESISRERELAEKKLKEIEDASKKIGEMFIQIKDLNDVQKELEDSKRLFEELNGVALQAEGTLDQMRREIDAVERQAKENETKKRKYEILLIQLKDYDEKKRRKDELLKEKEEVTAKIGETEYKIAGKDVNALEELVKEVVGKEKEIETRISSFDAFIIEKQSRKKEYEDKFKEVEKQKNEIEKFDSLVKNLRIFGMALEQTQIELRGEFIEAVDYAMNQLWSTLYPYQDFVGIRLNVEEGDYMMQLQERSGRWVNVEGVVSGGERSTAALALRIAFALVLAPQLRWLVLDEPTTNLDRRAVGELAITLRERIGEFIDQTFLITHQSELEDAVTGNAYMLERDKQKDGVTKVISLHQ